MWVAVSRESCKTVPKIKGHGAQVCHVSGSVAVIFPSTLHLLRVLSFLRHSCACARVQKVYTPPMDGSVDDPAVALGIGGQFSGVSFHTHGPGYSESIIGAKRWYLYPPDQAPGAVSGTHEHLVSNTLTPSRARTHAHVHSYSQIFRGTNPSWCG